MTPKRRQPPARALAFDPAIQAAHDAQGEAQAAKQTEQARQDRNAAGRARYAASRQSALPPGATRGPVRAMPGPPHTLPPGPILIVNINDWAAWKAAHGLRTDRYDRRGDLWYVTAAPLPGDAIDWAALTAPIETEETENDRPTADL